MSLRLGTIMMIIFQLQYTFSIWHTRQTPNLLRLRIHFIYKLVHSDISRPFTYAPTCETHRNYGYANLDRIVGFYDTTGHLEFKIALTDNVKHQRKGHVRQEGHPYCHHFILINLVRW